MKIKYETIINRIRDSLCPVCGQFNVTHGEVEISSDSCLQQVSCNDCETKWTEYYSLQGCEIQEVVDIDIPVIEDDLSSLKNVSDIMQAILQKRDLLPLLLGINKSMDELIAQRMKK